MASTSLEHHDHAPPPPADPLQPITVSTLIGYGVLALAGVVMARFVPGSAPLLIAAAVAALAPRRVAGEGWVRGALAIIAALLTLFVTTMWPQSRELTELPAESPTLLSWLLGLPIAGGVAVMFLPRQAPRVLRAVTLIVMFATLLLALPLLSVPMGRDYHFNQDFFWLESVGVHYHVAIDGVTLWLVMLTVFVMPIAAFVSFGSVTTRVKDWCIALLVLEGAMIGAFVALDLFLFYVFWELMLVPMYLMIGIWGGSGRLRATVKFFLYTMFGSMLMLAAILYLGYSYGELTGQVSFDYFDLQRLMIPQRIQIWLFAAFALSFLIKVPMFPLHTWLPDAHTEAPTAGSIILAAVMLKMGTYGYLRFCMGLFPEAAAQYGGMLAGVAVVGGILYGALCAWKQDDIKRLVAYSSVAHLGYVMLGLFAGTPSGIEGSVLQMVNHGISTGLLFLLVGVIYDRRHTRHVDDFGGLAKVMPVYTTFFIIATMASIGVPGLNGFVGEFMIIVGTYTSDKIGQVAGIQAVGAALGVILAALYMLVMVQKVFFGPVKHKENANLPDMNGRELVAAVPLMLMCFIIGLFPRIFLDPMHDACTRVREEMEERLLMHPAPSYQQGPFALQRRHASAPPSINPADAPPPPAAEAAADDAKGAN